MFEASSDPSSHGRSRCRVEQSLHLHSSKAHKLFTGDFVIVLIFDANGAYILSLLIQEAFRCKDDYFKAIGYKEVDGKIEHLDEYLERLSSYMKLYGALVQVCHSY